VGTKSWQISIDLGIMVLYLLSNRTYRGELRSAETFLPASRPVFIVSDDAAYFVHGMELRDLPCGGLVLLPKQELRLTYSLAFLHLPT